MCLGGANAQLNLPYGAVVPDLAPDDPREASACELKEDQEAHDLLELERTDEGYMAELHRVYPESVEVERRSRTPIKYLWPRAHNISLSPPTQNQQNSAGIQMNLSSRE